MEKGKRKSSSSAYDIRRDLQELIAVREEVHRCYKSICNEKPESAKLSYNPRDNRNKFEPRPNQSRNFVTRAFPVTKPNPRNQTHKRAESKPHPNRNRPNQTKGCLFCNPDHSSYKCLRAPNRTKRLAELQRCFKCLKPGHKTPECYSKRGCARSRRFFEVGIRQITNDGNSNPFISQYQSTNNIIAGIKIKKGY